MEDTMPCNNNCNQGRSCNCGSNKSDRAVVIVATLLLICIVSMGYGVYKLMHGNAGQECAVTLQFKDNVKATYIGKTV
jgi:hypothetical protein